jgi:hypothetical protein
MFLPGADPLPGSARAGFLARVFRCVSNRGWITAQSSKGEPCAVRGWPILAAEKLPVLSTL